MTPAAETSSSTQTVGSWDNLGESTSIRVVASAADPQPDAIREITRKAQLLQLARERFRVTVDAESTRRREMLIDQQFRCGLQWDPSIKLQREQQGRPCLVVNRIPGFLKHVLNNLRQSRPEIKIDPVGDGADEEVAEIRQGLIRHIQVQSRAEIAYDTAFESLATMGLGFVRVVDGWAGNDSFDKDLFIEWVPNPFSVYFDPGVRKPDWSDAKFCFVVEDISVAEFRQRFGMEFQAASASNFQSIGDHSPAWMPGGKIRIAEYFHIEEEDDTLCELADGTTVLFSKIQAMAQDSEAEQSPQEGEQAEGAQPAAEETAQPAMPAIVRTRPVKVPYVQWSLISGIDVLKERRWSGKHIPIVPFVGNQIELDGERLIVGMVRFAREAQRMFNYMYSCFVEAVALVPKSPWVAEFDQIQEFKDVYERANRELVAVLPYRNKSADNGSALPAPQRIQAEPPIQAFVEGLKLADNNLKATFSIYDASLGEKGPQESGLAINSRKVESELATYDWVDNFNRGVQYLGIILDDLLPHYYNTPGRIVQVIREDKTSKSFLMNQAHQGEDGDPKKYDLSQGKYAKTITSGPSHETRRKEAANAMVELAKMYPPLMQIAGPQIVREMDWPGKDVIAAQLEKAQPAELRAEDPDKKGQAQADAAAAQQKVAELSQMVQQLSKALTEASDKQALERMKEEFATMRTGVTAETQLAIAEMKAGSDEARVLVAEVFEEMKRMRAAVEQQMLGGQQQPQPQQPTSSAPSEPQAPAPQVPAGQPVGGPPAG